MKKIIAFMLAAVMMLLAGCAGTTVVIGNCTCPPGGHGDTPSTPLPEGALKTGLAITVSLTDSMDATKKDYEGKNFANYDVTFVAVLVDDQGVIHDCIIDGISTKVNFDNTGKITSDLSAEIKTKNELGDAYGMVAWGGAKYEWNVQAEALAKYAVGKTVQELKDGAIDESGKAPAGSDLAATATIYLGGYVSAIEKAVNNAKHLGAQSGDTLKLASVNGIGESVNAGEKDGTAQLDCDVTALTVKDGEITSCYIDALQAKVSFNASGKITSDLAAGAKTKNELGDAYGMVAWGGAKYEWNKQAENFAKYITGMTAAEVAGISINEATKPADGTDLAASVTISIGGFQALIAKALQ